MLKHFMFTERENDGIQPPLGGCVLKLPKNLKAVIMKCQPPLGGCVLKHSYREAHEIKESPAAFRRLCVETLYINDDFLIELASRL